MYLPKCSLSPEPRGGWQAAPLQASSVIARTAWTSVSQPWSFRTSVVHPFSALLMIRVSQSFWFSSSSVLVHLHQVHREVSSFEGWIQANLSMKYLYSSWVELFALAKASQLWMPTRWMTSKLELRYFLDTVIYTLINNTLQDLHWAFSSYLWTHDHVKSMQFLHFFWETLLHSCQWSSFGDNFRKIKAMPILSPVKLYLAWDWHFSYTNQRKILHVKVQCLYW
jgi:hypothetical protein